MGNSIDSSSTSSTSSTEFVANANTLGYKDFFTSLSDEQIEKINKEFKVIKVDWLDKKLIEYKMFGDEYFNKNPEKKKLLKI